MGGPGSHIQARLSDCYSAGTLWGGFAPTIPGAPFIYPNPGPGPIPFAEIDLVIERCERFLPGSFIRGKVRTVDTMVIVDAGLYGAVSDIDLDIDYTLDRPSFFGGQPLRVLGPPNLHTRFSNSSLLCTPPRDCRFRVRTHITDAARKAGRKIGPGFEWSGLIGPRVTCRLSDCDATAAPPRRMEAKPGDDPRVSRLACPPERHR